MQLNGFSQFVETLKKQDLKGALTLLLSDPVKRRALLEQSHKQLHKTMDFLAEFGTLHQPIERLKRAVREMKSTSQQTLQQLASISTEELVEIYSVAYDLFLKKQFEQAAEIAIFLGVLNPEISSFWRLLGSCYWNQNNPKDALGPFLYAATQDATSIDNHAAVLECLVKLGMTQEALNYYQIAKEVLSNAHKLEGIKRLDLLLSNL